MEYSTDPQLMAAVTPDSHLEPTAILQRLEDHWEETGELISIEEYLMSGKATTNAVKDNAPEAPVEGETVLPFLNKRTDNSIGVLHITTHFHAHMTEEAAKLRRNNVWNLYWIAMMLGEFGSLPTFEDVYETAPSVASAPDTFVLNRELVPDSYAFQNQDTRKLISGKQYARIMQNAERIQQNTLVINLLREAGYASALTKEEMFQEIDVQQRMRNAERKAQEDNATIANNERMKLAAGQVDCGID